MDTVGVSANTESVIGHIALVSASRPCLDHDDHISDDSFGLSVIVSANIDDGPGEADKIDDGLGDFRDRQRLNPKQLAGDVISGPGVRHQTSVDKVSVIRQVSVVQVSVIRHCQRDRRGRDTGKARRVSTMSSRDTGKARPCLDHVLT